MNKTFLLTFVQGPNYQAEKSFHDQLYWENHSRFSDKLFLQGIITMCGPLADASKTLLLR